MENKEITKLQKIISKQKKIIIVLMAYVLISIVIMLYNASF